MTLTDKIRLLGREAMNNTLAEEAIREVLELRLGHKVMADLSLDQAAALNTVTALKDQVDDLRAWALSRIRQCRRDEAKAGAGDVAIEAARERIVLTTTLGFFGIRVPANTETPGPSQNRSAPRRQYLRRIDKPAKDGGR